MRWPAGPRPRAEFGLADSAKFFAAVKAPALFTAALKPDQKAGLEAVLAAAAAAEWPLSFAAYALATAFHETAATMQPVREAFWLSQIVAQGPSHQILPLLRARLRPAHLAQEF